ncbi:MAG: PH domain-containing protein [Bacteroidetes Order II. Incertae sedis bacterium]|nr:PH domain-containing protein [Bacteroidetes Order II. bacterium]
MVQVYKSKIGLELVIPIALVLGTVLILSAWEEPRWVGPLIILAVGSFIYYVFTTTYYVIDQNMLRVKSAFFIDLKIDIQDIHTIAETRNPLSAPAISLDRLEVRYGHHGRVLISPKDKAGFIREIQHINPHVVVRLKGDFVP